MPKIPGSTTAKGYEQWIPIFSLNCGVQRKIEITPGRVFDRIHSDVLGTEMEIIKPVDQSSPLLFSEVCGGSAIPEITLDVCYSSTDGFVMYLQYILSNVLVSGYHLHVDANGHYEIISLNYTDIEMGMIPQDASGQLESPIRMRAQISCWPDLATYARRKILTKTQEGFNLFVATVYGEAGGVHHGSRTAWKAVGSVIMNRIHKGIWHRYNTSEEIIKHTGFNAYMNPNRIKWDHVNFTNHYYRNHQQFLKAWAMLHEQKINHQEAMSKNEKELLAEMRKVLTDIYQGHPITNANYYYSPRSMPGRQPSFLSPLKNPEQYKVLIPGIWEHDFKFYYIPTHVERTAGKKP